MTHDPIELQKKYYRETANNYDSMHLDENDEHFMSLHMLSGLIEFYKIRSILDVGAGTGRVAQFLGQKFPDLYIRSIEPIEALREIGYKKGLTSDELTPGDATSLEFKNGEFDLVCAFGVFHHLPNPKRALLEMKRVSSKYLFISDSNNFGVGNLVARTIKQILNALRLWKLAIFIKTKGKIYQVSEGDGIFYSFSIFDLFPLLNTYKVFPISTSPSKGNIYKDASHVSIFAIKQKSIP